MTVTIDKTGHVQLPEEVRNDLGLQEGDQLDVEVTRGPGGTAVVLRQHIPDEDAWLYNEENLASIRRADADIAAGRVFRMSEADLRGLADVADEVEE